MPLTPIDIANASIVLHKAQRHIKSVLENQLDHPNPTIRDEVIAARIIELHKNIELVRIDFGGLIKEMEKGKSNAQK